MRKRSVKRAVTTLAALAGLSLALAACRGNSDVVDVVIEEIQAETPGETEPDTAGEAIILSAAEIAKMSADACAAVTSLRYICAMDFEITIPDSFANIEAKIEYTTDLVKDPYGSYLKMHYEIDTSEDDNTPLKAEVERLLEEYEDEHFSYISSDGGETWYRSDRGDAPIKKDIINTRIIQSIAEGKTVAEVAEAEGLINDHECYLITSQITGTDLETAATGVTGDMFTILEQFFDYTEEEPIAQVKYWIDKLTFLPVKSSMDMSQGMDKILSGHLKKETDTSASTGIEFRFVIEVLFSNYNAIDEITIPERAKTAEFVTREEYAQVFTEMFAGEETGASEIMRNTCTDLESRTTSPVTSYPPPVTA